MLKIWNSRYESKSANKLLLAVPPGFPRLNFVVKVSKGALCAGGLVLVKTLLGFSAVGSRGNRRLFSLVNYKLRLFFPFCQFLSYGILFRKDRDGSCPAV